MRAPHALIFAALIAATAVAGAQSQEGFRFKSGVELVNVTATVTDEDGRFVSGLRKEDFTVYEDGKLQEVSHFSNERVPVSLGIVLDTSGSMTPDKMSAARSAIDRFIYDLLGKDDELFFMDFATRARLRQDWTTDRRVISRAVRETNATGGTAMYDAVADGDSRRRRRARTEEGAARHLRRQRHQQRDSVGELRQQIRESEVLVYALGVDGSGRRVPTAPTAGPDSPADSVPVPGGRRPGPAFRPSSGGGGGRLAGRAWRPRERRCASTDYRRHRRAHRDRPRLRGIWAPATARIADELSKQYYLGYSSNAERDGRWHAIRVDVRDRRLTVRARRGYVAS